MYKIYNSLLEEIIAKNLNRPGASTSGGSTDPLIKISEIAEALKFIPAKTRSTFMVRGKFTVAFELTVERILDCTTTDIIQHAEQEDHSYIENITNRIQDKEWMIVLGASMNEFGKLRQNKLNVLSVNYIPGTAK
ncbi:hypothetical protein F2P56_027496 [Juglans regia]|uniref:Uncharacterized protein n=1 Tax=Juglans regia TaxID=51240 RepID=A0A833U3V9_JUGRE|nr:hypothetical protein F2P56_027496 [Juglans regia]